TPVTVDSTGDVGYYTSLAIVNSNPAISYLDITNGDLKYVRASDASGTSWSGPVTVDNTGRVGYFTSLAVVDGNPAISYYDDTNGDLKYVRASDASGTSWGTPVTVDSTGLVGFFTSLVVVDGNPAISYLDYGNGNLKWATLVGSPAPEIAVSGNGVEITSGDAFPDVADHTDFGTITVFGNTITRTFTIGNPGSAALNLTGSPKAAITGAHAADFSVTAQPASPLAPAGTATFSITFSPTAVGLRTAAVSIDNDDANESPYTFAIQGLNSALPIDISFSSAIYTIDQGTPEVSLTLVRTGDTPACQVTLNTNDGTASTVPPFAAAAAGTDYVDLTGPATTVFFADGETTKVVTVTLIPRSGSAALQNRRFTATLSGPTANALPGSIATASIQILAIDNSSPTLSIITPAGATFSAAWPCEVKGTAGDAKGIARVEVSLNGAPPVLALLGSSTLNTSIPWSVNVLPTPGPNTLTVTAYDLSENSASVRRRFTFTQRYVLSLYRVAPVGIPLNTAGTVALIATPSTAATALAPTALDANPKTSSILPGTLVKVTATPKTGYVFSHWSGTPAGTVNQGNVITFIMPAADAAGVTATFVANPFIGPIGSGNVFYGLIHPEGATTSSNATEGFITGTLTPASGLFSGKVLIDGVVQSFVATFYGDGSSLFTIGAMKLPMLIFGSKSLTLSFSGGNILATVVNGANTSEGTASRAIYSSTNKVPAALLNLKVPATAPSPTQGFFTLGFPAKTQTPGIDVSTYPQGDGFGALTLTNLGIVTLTGTLADGTAITGSSGLVAGNTCPIFIQLVTPGAAATVKGGSFGGVITFDTTHADSDVSGTDLLWFRPAVTAVTTPAAAALATNRYTAGWPNGIRVDAVGALYNKAATVQTSLGLGDPNPATGNAQLVFSDGKLTSSIAKTNINISANVITKIPTSDASFTLIAVPTTGAFSGTFTPNWTSPAVAKPAFKGILIQKGANKGGYGYFLSNRLSDLDPESGGVTLSGP
ncbi:MAG: choice-of-anchor D domain-containing protein, partial [Prosthecobacter sp.]|nr:choice-of-anchor D domain-containing protein [Prosthecobacter sp.]